MVSFIREHAYTPEYKQVVAEVAAAA